MDENKIILCRCENFTLADLHRLLDSGVTSMQEIKKHSRCTMGPCQGRTCKEMIAREIANYLHKKVDEIDVPVSRIPIKPITLGQIVGGIEK
ncbi:(2Fe-2S)-binding protein [Anoxybacterium hadale]|uniref:(2Fe-2S)-binding protein n=1 Tax=Anoxybacterium hadale TaxID=3408580 RepID=A0ACD1A672_9FIRM|nr:(2Fe-2S)-binding protein [Clostridiales bacterium]